MEIKKCSFCKVEEGKLHLCGCPSEVCSGCGVQVQRYGRCNSTKPEPFFSVIGYRCKRCGVYLPDLKMVSNKEWKFICGGTYPLERVLCVPCMNFIKKKRKENK